MPQPGTPQGPAADMLGNQLSTPFATQTGGGGVRGRSYNEEFDGDMGGMFYSRIATGVSFTTQVVQTGTVTRVITNPTSGVVTHVQVPVFGTVVVPVKQSVLVPVAGRYSGVNLTDDDSPRPTNRLYFNYNYYDRFGNSFNPGLGDIIQNRETMGFEKTILDGNASIGMRLPFVQLAAPAGLGQNTVGDLSVLFKYALIYNRDTGNVLSLGMIITTPTAAAGGQLSDGTNVPHSVLFQPWVGFVRTFRNWYVQGVGSVIVPTEGRDTILLGNSLGFGYWLFKSDSRLLPSVTPTFEIHVRTPLNNRDPNGLVFLQDQVNLTSGLHFWWNRFVISGAVGVPVVGPRPWNIEGIANAGIRF
jgi:hypothetical protein